MQVKHLEIVVAVFGCPFCRPSKRVKGYSKIEYSLELEFKRTVWSLKMSKMAVVCGSIMWCWNRKEEIDQIILDMISQGPSTRRSPPKKAAKPAPKKSAKPAPKPTAVKTENGSSVKSIVDNDVSSDDDASDDEVKREDTSDSDDNVVLYQCIHLLVSGGHVWLLFSLFPSISHHSVCSIITTHNLTPVNMMVETHLTSVYNTHIPGRTHHRSQSWTKYVSSWCRVYYALLRLPNTL